MTEPAVEPTEPVQTEPQGAEPAKEKTDWKAEARKWEARAKENKGASDELEKIKKAQMTELEKAQAEAEEAKKEAAKLKAEKDRNEALKQAADGAGVDIELLALMAGDTPEQIAVNAATLKTKIAGMPVYPTVDDNGGAGAPVITKEQIEKIKNPAERVKMRAQHSELYK